MTSTSQSHQGAISCGHSHMLISYSYDCSFSPSLLNVRPWIFGPSQPHSLLADIFPHSLKNPRYLIMSLSRSHLSSPLPHCSVSWVETFVPSPFDAFLYYFSLRVRLPSSPLYHHHNDTTSSCPSLFALSIAISLSYNPMKFIQ